jgi:hypothetical protein
MFFVHCQYIAICFGKLKFHVIISIQVKVLAPFCNGLPIPVAFQISHVIVLQHVIIFRETRLPS